MRVVHRCSLVCVAVLLVACTGASQTTSASSSVASSSPPATPLTSTASPEPKTGTIVARPVATGLDHPAAFVVAHDGSIFYGERLTGEIRRIDPATGKNTSVFTVPGVIGSPTDEQGLVGLTVPPDFPDTPWLYAYASRDVHGQARDQIVRMKIDGGPGGSMQIVLDVKEASER